MNYTPNRPNPGKLRVLIWKHFGDVPKSDSHFTKWRGIHAEEFDASENIDLETATVEDVHKFYESNTHYAPNGYKLRFPRIFSLLCRLGLDAAHTDFVDAFFRVNISAERPEYFETYSAEQKYCVWLVYDYLDLHFEEICLFDDDAKRIMEERDCNLEVVDYDAIETPSLNLFGTEEPPLEAIKVFGAELGNAE